MFKGCSTKRVNIGIISSGRAESGTFKTHDKNKIAKSLAPGALFT